MQRIRESCNHCGSQKIRCGKERPHCDRCVSKGLDCRYTVSRRTGQRRRSTQETTKDTQPATPNDFATSSIRPNDFNSLDFNAFDPIETDAAHNDSAWFFGTPGNPSIDIDAEYFDPSMLEEVNGTGNDSLSLTNTLSHPYMNTASTQNNDIASFFGQHQHEPKSGQPPPWESPKASAIHKGHVGNLDAGSAHATHDCIAEAMRIVVDLHVSDHGCILASSDPVSYMQNSKDCTRDVDTVLYNNREAIGTLNRILDCPCSTHQGLLLACYLAIQKIVSWYAAIVGVEKGLADHEPRLLADRIATRPIFMGKYCLDIKVQQLVRAQVVLTELRDHVHPLLDRLPRQTQPQQIGIPMPLTPGSTITSRSSSSPPQSTLMESHQYALQEQLKSITAVVNHMGE